MAEQALKPDHVRLLDGRLPLGRTSCSGFPELTRPALIALSGVYSTRDFFGAALDGGIYFNSPLDYLAGLTDEGILARLRAAAPVRLLRQGRMGRTHACRNAPAGGGSCATRTFLPGSTIGGSDASHDWPWWHRQLVYFMQLWLDQDAQAPRGVRGRTRGATAI